MIKFYFLLAMVTGIATLAQAADYDVLIRHGTIYEGDALAGNE